MAGVTDTVFRGLCRRLGADAVVSEMVSAEGLGHGSQATRELLALAPAERPVGIQLFGADPSRLGEAAAVVCELAAPDFIDLNGGCPVRKVVRRNGGASLMKDPHLFGRIVEAMVRQSSVPVSVKIRSGWRTGEWVDVELARIAEQSGAAALTLHPRSAAMLYSGHSFWERIAVVKQSVGIPVIGNGDITRPEHARDMLARTGCDSVMIGRGALGNPWLFAQCRDLLEQRQPRIVAPAERLGLALEHLRLFREIHGERRCTAEMKRHVAWYTRGIVGGARARGKLFRAHSSQELEQVLVEALRGQEVAPHGDAEALSRQSQRSGFPEL